jgi:hypothetical protein
MSLAAFASVELDSGMKALFVTRRSLWARFEIGVATTTRVTLAPLFETRDRAKGGDISARGRDQVQLIRDRISEHDVRGRVRTQIRQRDRVGNGLPDLEVFWFGIFVSWRSAWPWAAATLAADKPTTAITTTRVRRDVGTPFLYRMIDLDCLISPRQGPLLAKTPAMRDAQ